MKNPPFGKRFVNLVGQCQSCFYVESYSYTDELDLRGRPKIHNPRFCGGEIKLFGDYGHAYLRKG